MSLSSFKHIVDMINDMHIIHDIHMLGGEPTLLDNLIDYVSYLQSDNINEIVIMSNGYRPDDYFIPFEKISKLHMKFTYHPEYCTPEEFLTKCLSVNKMAFKFSTIIMIDSEQYLDSVIWLYNKLKEANIKTYIKIVHNDNYVSLLDKLKPIIDEDDYPILYLKTEEGIYKDIKPLIYIEDRFFHGMFCNWYCKKYSMLDIMPNTLLKLSCSRDTIMRSALSKKFWSWYKLNYNKYYICTNIQCSYCTSEIPKYVEL
jgi:organic radical activating enzyme